VAVGCKAVLGVKSRRFEFSQLPTYTGDTECSRSAVLSTRTRHSILRFELQVGVHQPPGVIARQNGWSIDAFL
jgi:hypothetical protein